MAKIRHYRTPVTIHRLGGPEIETNDFVPDAPTWKPLFLDRADFRTLRGREEVDAQQIHDGAVGEIYFRWSSRWASVDLANYRHKITSSHWGPRVYVVKSVRNMDEANNVAVVMVELSTESEVAACN